MRILSIVALVVLASCDQSDPDPPDEEEVQLELLMQIAEDWDTIDVAAFESELVEDAAGCMQPKWLYIPVYSYNPDTFDSDGMHMEDRTFPVSEFNEDRPRIVAFQVEEPGNFVQVGIEWYYEPPGQEEEFPPPQVFGVSMDGMMDPHTPYQFLHYDLHAWIWNYTSEDNDHGFFGLFNKGMTPPSWWFDYEPTLFDSFFFYAPAAAYAERGYVASGVCEDNVGFRHTNAPPTTGAAPDGFNPNSVFTDVNGLWVGSEWTVADEGAGAPTLFGQTFQGPDAAGNYTLRVWPGIFMNPAGFFNPTHELVDCAAPAIPPECM